MCMGVPGRIVAISTAHPHVATVDMMGVEREVNIGLVEPDGPRPGDWVDVHMGMALAILEEDEAEEIIGFLLDLEEGRIDTPHDP